MKLAIVNNDLGSGGAEKLIYDMSLELKKDNNIKFDIIILNSKNEVYKKELEKNNINVISLDSRFGIYNPLHILKLRKILKNYDVVHVHVFPSQYWVGLAGKILPRKIKFITTEHSTTNGRRNKLFFKYFDSFIYKTFTNIVCISQETKKQLLEWIIENRIDKFKIIENGINLKKFQMKEKDNRSKYSLEVEDIILIMISRFNRSKDHKTVIKALEKLPLKYKLLLLGEGEEKENIKRYIKEKKVENRVKILGFKKNINEYIKMSNIGIQSSYYEGFGLTTIEIMASGIPLLANDIPGMRDVVGNKELLFESQNENDLVKKILELENEKYKNINISLGLKRAQKFGIKEVVKKYKEVYR